MLCYQLNSVSLIQSASECDYIWRQGLYWSSYEWALIQWLVPLYRKRRLGYRHMGKTTGGAQWKCSHLWTKEKISKNQSCQYLDLRLLTSRNMRNKFLLFKYTHSVIFYCNSPRQLLHFLQSEKKIRVSLLITSLH